MSWALEAVEREAMQRAVREVMERGPAMVAGCTVPQILWLIHDYHLRTGQLAQSIDPAAMKAGPQ